MKFNSCQIKKQLRIKSSTLFEVIVAMLIASFVFVSSASIILNTLSRNKLVREFYSQTVANNLLVKKRGQLDMESRITETPLYIIEEKVTPYNGIPTLLIMSVIVYDKHGLRLAMSRVIIRNNEYN